jgi:hypothetical protein
MTHIGKQFAVKGLNPNGEGLVQIYISFSRSTRKVISTGVYIQPQCWDKANSIVINHELAKKYNGRITTLIKEILNLEAECASKNVYFTPQTIDHYLSSGKETKIFNEFYLSELKKPGIKPDTYKDQLKTLNHLNNFKGKIYFHELNPPLILRFHKYLTELGHAETTIFFHHKNLKKYINLAISCGYLSSDKNKHPYKDIHPEYSKTQRPFLTLSQVMKVYNTSYTTERLRRVADRFVFACCTGLKVSDLSKVTADKFDGALLHIQPKSISKTSGVGVSLPIKLLFNGLPYEILFKYDMVLPLFNDADYNQLLKLVADQAKVPPLVSQVARHTFLTQIALQQNKVFSVMKLGGICSTETAMIYINMAKNIKLKNK